MRRGSDPLAPDLRAFRQEIRAQHPPFIRAVLADARLTAACRAERFEFRSPLDAAVQALRLMWVSDAFLAQVCYRAKARMQALGVPIAPRLAHRLAMAIAQICIGDPVVVRPGVYIAHGQVVIGGITTVETGVVIFPWVTLGLRSGNSKGPTIGPRVTIGSGAKVIGPVTVGAGANIGANAVVVDDVAAGTTVAGAPARPLHRSPQADDG